MILFLSHPETRPGAAHHYGDFITPARWSHSPRTETWAADNGAFSNFEPDRFRRMLDAFAEAPTRPKFVAVPDVVGDWFATLERWLEWAPEMRSRRMPRALVLQNGAEHLPPEHSIPWANVDALFIGGDTPFKFSPWVARAVHLARGAGVWCHMGRVNSVRRLAYAEHIGCSSCDGSGMARFPSKMLPPLIEHLERGQLLLF